MDKIKMTNGILSVPDCPEILYITGDGVGSEITPVMRSVVDAAVKSAYEGTKSIVWKEVLAGSKAYEEKGSFLPEETVSAIKENLVAIKGPLMTPVGKGMRSLNVRLRQEMDLYVCQRPVKYYSGVVSPMKKPEDVDMTVFRENTEDIYAGIEWESSSDDAKKVISFLSSQMNVNKIRFPSTSAIGIKPVSPEGSKRLIRSAIDYAIKNRRKSVTLVHKGNIMKFTEGGFRAWGYEVARNEYGAAEENGLTYIPLSDGGRILIKDVICDAFLQNIILKSRDYDVIATLNLNGDYVSDALAALVGGIGIAPGANINYKSGVAVFEATHGTAPDIAGKNVVNPLSMILSAKMMLDYIGFSKASEVLDNAVKKTLISHEYTKDLYSSASAEYPDAKLFGTAEYGNLIISHMEKNPQEQS